MLVNNIGKDEDCVSYRKSPDQFTAAEPINAGAVSILGDGLLNGRGNNLPGINVDNGSIHGE